MKTLRYNNRSIRRLKEECGIDLLSTGWATPGDNSSGLEVFPLVYWAGRLSENPAMTIAEAALETDDMTPGELTGLVGDALRASMRPPGQPEAEAGEPKSGEASE